MSLVAATLHVEASQVLVTGGPHVGQQLHIIGSWVWQTAAHGRLSTGERSLGSNSTRVHGCGWAAAGQNHLQGAIIASRRGVAVLFASGLGAIQDYR